MIQRTPLSDHASAQGHVVRGPSPGDGVGLALRTVFSRDLPLPAMWSDYLRRLDDLPRC